VTGDGHREEKYCGGNQGCKALPYGYEIAQVLSKNLVFRTYAYTNAPHQFQNQSSNLSFSTPTDGTVDARSSARVIIEQVLCHGVRREVCAFRIHKIR
jgi:hypothetical protein